MARPLYNIMIIKIYCTTVKLKELLWSHLETYNQHAMGKTLYTCTLDSDALTLKDPSNISMDTLTGEPIPRGKTQQSICI